MAPSWRWTPTPAPRSGSVSPSPPPANRAATPGRPGAYKSGGGGAWLTGSYDADTNTLFWGVGNPGPWLATLRPGKNLFTDSVIAMDPATGNIKWHFQYTPHDTWDYDGTNEDRADQHRL